MNNKKRLFLLSIIIFFIGSLAATTLVWFITVTSLQIQIKNKYYLDSNNAISWIENRLNTYTDILKGLSAFVENNHELSLTKWNRYVNSLDIINRYPGLRSINYIQRVPHNYSANPAYKNYVIHPIDSHYIKTQTDYYPVVYTSGIIKNPLQVLGYDVSSEARRAQTLFAARDSAQPATTTIIRLIADPKNLGFGLMFPYYNQETQSFSGVIYATFDINQFFDSILKPSGRDAFPNLDFEVYDQKQDLPRAPIYDKDTSLNLINNKTSFLFINKHIITIADRTWSLYIGVKKDPRTDPLTSPITITILVSGILASFLTFSFLLRQYYHELKN